MQTCFRPQAARSSSVDHDHSRVNWEEYVRRQVRANETYSEAKHQFSIRNIDVLMNVQSLISGGPLSSPLCSAQVRHCLPWSVRVALSKLLKREGRAGVEDATLPYVGHLQLISTLKIGADCCQLCQYKLTKPNLTQPNLIYPNQKE